MYLETRNHKTQVIKLYAELFNAIRTLSFSKCNLSSSASGMAQEARSADTRYKRLNNMPAKRYQVRIMQMSTHYLSTLDNANLEAPRDRVPSRGFGLGRVVDFAIARFTMDLSCDKKCLVVVSREHFYVQSL